MDIETRIKRTRIAIVAILGAVLIAALGAFLFFNSLLGGVGRIEKPGTAQDDKTQKEKFDEDSWKSADKDVMKDKDVQNILLIGQDKREGEERQRSDSMIICSVNKKTGKITLVSLMRDMYVPIPGYESNRINSSYSLGGMDLLDQTIEEDFGVHIDGNVEVDFAGFIKAMTNVGDLDIYLRQEEADYLNYELDRTDLKAGMNSMDPKAVLMYARTRYVGDGDYERTERQRKVLMTAFAKLRKSDLGTIVRVAKSILPYFTTDLTRRQMLGYVYTVITDDMTINRETYRLPVDGAYTNQRINEMDVLVPDMEMNKEALIEYLYGPQDDSAQDGGTQDAHAQSGDVS